MKQLLLIFGSLVLVGFVVVMLALFAPGCIHRGEQTRPGAKQVPPLGIKAGESISDFDFVVDGGRTLHLVWTVRRDATVTSKSQLFYRSGDLAAGTWSAPQRIAQTGGGSPRIVSLGSQLHVVVADSLRHFVSRDDGLTWRETTPLLPAKFGIAQKIDVATDSSSMLVGYFAIRYEGESASRRQPQSLWVTRWSDGLEPRTALVNTIPGPADLSTSPRLLSGPHGVHLLWSLNRHGFNEKQSASGPVHAYYGIGSLFHSSSSDHGATWSRPDSSSWPEEFYQPPNSSTVYEFEAAAVGMGQVVLTGNWALHCASSVNGKDWYPGRSVTASRQGLLPNSLKVSSISAAAHGHAGQVVWIDNRNQRTDWYMELLLHPHDWANNDVFAVPLDRLVQSGHSDRVQPVRLTRDLSYASTVRAHAARDKIYVVWVGRSRVGKSIDTGKPPEIFYTTLPLQRGRALASHSRP